MRSYIGTIGLGLLLGLSLTSSAWALGISRGPMLQAPGRSEMMIVFDLDQQSAAELHYGPSGGALNQVAASPETRRHKVSLTGLQAGTSYQYQVWAGGAPLSEIFSFQTAPNPGEAFNFIVFGDTRSNHNVHAVLISLMQRHDFSFFVNSGDLVSDGEEAGQWVTYFDIQTPVLAEHPLFPVIGNHDEHEGNAALYVDAFEISTASSGEEEYYSATYGNVHLTVLDHHVNVTPQWLCVGLLFMSDCFTSKQLAWLETDLAMAQADPTIDHIIVTVHIGPYSSKDGRNGSAQMRALLPVFQQYGVDLILSGHDHYYMRGLSGNGIPYVISGGGGAGLYECNNDNSWLYPHTTEVKNMVHHYILVKVVGPQMSFTVYDLDDREIDRFEIGARPACVVDEDCSGDPPVSCDGHWECIHYECSWICDPDQVCETDEDCTGDPPAPCDGHWECIDSECRWICEPGAPCETDEDCVGEPSTPCDSGVGHWICTPNKTCLYICDEVGECVTDEDCRDLEPYNDCPMGFYWCKDHVCDWECPPLPDGDAGGGDADGGEGGSPVDGDEGPAPCTPGSTRCDGNWVVTCNGSGSGWDRTEDCGEAGCEVGVCLSPDDGQGSPDGGSGDGNGPSGGSGTGGAGASGEGEGDKPAGEGAGAQADASGWGGSSDTGCRSPGSPAFLLTAFVLLAGLWLLRRRPGWR